MTEENLIWNRFIEEVCKRDIESLSELQRKAVLCFWYDAEMNGGGFSSFKDNFPDTDYCELEKTVLTVGNKEIADNLHKAVIDGEKDDWAETDDNYYVFSPSLSDYLQKFVLENREKLLLG